MSGPRGRGLCMEVAYSLNEDVPASYLLDRRQYGRLIRALEDVDPAPVAERRDPLAFLEPVEQSVSNAMYWEEPPQEDAVAAEPGVIDALRPVATAVASSPASAWWGTSLDLAAMRYTCRFDQNDPPSPPTLTGARERLHGWRADIRAEERHAVRDRPADPTLPLSGSWWSSPTMASLVTTTRPLPGLGSLELAWEEDSLGQDRAAIWLMATTRTPRVWEIDRARDWARLVDRYPLDVTHTRRHDWYRTTGRVGTWRIPDWDAVATDWDAVHLSVAGYLTSATRALRLADGEAATVLAGWNPDQTWWLNDVLATKGGYPEWWRNPDDPDGPDLAWYRESR